LRKCGLKREATSNAAPCDTHSRPRQPIASPYHRDKILLNMRCCNNRVAGSWTVLRSEARGVGFHCRESVQINNSTIRKQHRGDEGSKAGRPPTESYKRFMSGRVCLAIGGGC
jgi:hypothetical protein